MKGHVLVVDGDQVSRLMLRHMLAGLGYGSGEAYDVASATAELAITDSSAVISNYRLPDGTGMDVLTGLQARTPPPAFALITDVSEWDDETDDQFKDFPFHLNKPVSTTELEQWLRATARSRS